ncbi:MAG: cbb3-type cytochrome c oxidase subunit I [Bdellovibrionales bacterium]|nr:cbb3-type cytochrome c oxidase subunit I [Bdellovibrionales bacterium]
MSPTSATPTESLVDYEVIKKHFFATLFYLVVVLLAGLSYSLQFLQKYPFPGVELLSPGRIRIVHTMGVAYGMLANGLFATVYYIVPKLTSYQVLSRKLSHLCFWVYNALVIGTVVLVLAGFTQGLEWAETPKVLDPFIAIAVVLLVINLITPIWKARSQVFYVSLWYITAALIWTPIVYVFGNFLPEYVFAGTSGAAISSMYIHDLVGLFVTPLGIAAVYYLLPVVMRVPLYSHALSIIGFWGLAFFYPLNSAHHYLYSPIPMWAQYASIVASIGVHVVVYTVVFNIIATVAGDWKQLITNLPVRWIFAGTLAYLITCIQCAVQVTLSAQGIIHFTDWVVGHAHFVLFGVFTFWITAWIYWLLPRILGVPIFSVSLARWHFWLATLGIVIMQVDLLAAGVTQGMMWRSLAPFIDSVRASMPFWWTRTFSGMVILSGEACFLINVYLTWKESRLPRDPAALRAATQESLA